MKTRSTIIIITGMLSGCSLPPIHFYTVKTGYFLTDGIAKPFLNQQIDLTVTDPSTETEKPKEELK